MSSSFLPSSPSWLLASFPPFFSVSDFSFPLFLLIAFYLCLSLFPFFHHLASFIPLSSDSLFHTYFVITYFLLSSHFLFFLSLFLVEEGRFRSLCTTSINLHTHSSFILFSISNLKDVSLLPYSHVYSLTRDDYGKFLCTWPDLNLSLELSCLQFWHSTFSITIAFVFLHVCVYL